MKVSKQEKIPNLSLLLMLLSNKLQVSCEIKLLRKLV